MNKPEYQSWPDGTLVRFTAAARESMAPRKAGDFRFPKPLRTPKGGADGVFTMDNTDDTLHDVILRENGERWGIYWLEGVEDHEVGSHDAT